MTKEQFRILLVISLFLTVVQICVSIIAPASLMEEAYPAIAADYNQVMRDWAMGNPLLALGFMLSLAVLILMLVVSYISLFLMFAWGRYIYTVTIAFAYSLMLVVPQVMVSSMLEYLLGTVSAMLEGAILLAIWTDPLRVRFRGVRKESL